ncbi:hypothetical protein AOLI_G00035910 [Acnodon oligacanthus]
MHGRCSSEGINIAAVGCDPEFRVVRCWYLCCLARSDVLVTLLGDEVLFWVVRDVVQVWLVGCTELVKEVCAGIVAVLAGIFGGVYMLVGFCSCTVVFSWCLVWLSWSLRGSVWVLVDMWVCICSFSPANSTFSRETLTLSCAMVVWRSGLGAEAEGTVSSAVVVWL